MYLSPFVFVNLLGDYDIEVVVVWFLFLSFDTSTVNQRVVIKKHASNTIEHAQHESDIPRLFSTTTSEVMNTKSNVNSSTSSPY